MHAYMQAWIYAYNLIDARASGFSLHQPREGLHARRDVRKGRAPRARAHSFTHAQTETTQKRARARPRAHTRLRTHIYTSAHTRTLTRAWRRHAPARTRPHPGTHNPPHARTRPSLRLPSPLRQPREKSLSPSHPLFLSRRDNYYAINIEIKSIMR